MWIQTQLFCVCVLQCVSARTKKRKREREKHTATVSITKIVSESRDGRLPVGGWLGGFANQTPGGEREPVIGVAML